MMTSALSSEAFRKVAKVYEAIVEHPFNQQMIDGSLNADRFAYYIDQDYLYLEEYARCLALIAAKIDTPNIPTFLKYAQSAFNEREVVHQHYMSPNQQKQRQKSGDQQKISPALLAYTSYLLRCCALEPVEVAVAAVLPCFWVYMKLGVYAKGKSVAGAAENPYSRWIDAYSSEEFAVSTAAAVTTFDQLAEQAGEKLRGKMLEAFYRATVYEWQFWNDAYQKRVFDDVTTTIPHC